MGKQCVRIDLTGQRYGRLVVLAQEPETRKGVLRWHVLCDCGTRTSVTSARLRYGITRSCGCLRRELLSQRAKERPPKHDPATKPTLSVWSGMRQRCENPNSPAFPKYGGRGITVCERWRDFEKFVEDMGLRPPGMTIERADNDGNYSPENCRWATRAEQNRNKRNNVRLTWNGETKCVAQWAASTGINLGTLWGRIRKGWTIEKALTTPVNVQFSRRPAARA